MHDAPEPPAAPRVYPSPTIVVGVGRLGLAVLERLGEDWDTLARSGADPSLTNLRLVHVTAGDEAGEGDPRWRAGERESAAVADSLEQTDLPSLALDLAILRSLGLVRFRDGAYQVAVPQDAGVVERNPDDPHSLERLRYFVWRDLSADPVVAAERLQRLAGRSSDLDLFVTPLLSRVRQGHSPRTLLACIARAAAMAQGRDPSPWPWARRRLAEAPPGAAARDVVATAWDLDDLVELTGEPAELLVPPLLEPWAPTPLSGWGEWCRWAAVDGNRRDARPLPDGGRLRRSGDRLRLVLPAAFVPRGSDVDAWIDPIDLLRLDWQTSGWAAGLDGQVRSLPFAIAAASPFRLGLFDHDGTTRGGEQERFERRLRRLGELVHKGLVRMWVDLQRERVEERQPEMESRRREHDEDALRQTLEVLGELVVRRIGEEVDGGGDGSGGRTATEPSPLPPRPSRFLLSLAHCRRRTLDPATAALTDRLAALGLGEARGSMESEPLFSQIAVSPDQVADRGGEEDEDPGLEAVRHLLNHQTRQLLDVGTLTAYRTQPSRRPPRLTVLLIGDIGEPFVRAALRPLLRDVHAELLRSFGPILEYFREGFDRGLSVLPILWMPHPADPFESGDPTGRRREEAAIINAVHGVRRWVESVIPPTRRRVSQIFVNSRVNDTAVVDRADAVRQTRDFVSLLIRNDPPADPWLRRAAEGVPGDDYFSSFTCYAVELPAEKGREYLANRLARDCLQALERPRGGEPADVPEDLLAPPRLGERLEAAQRELGEEIEAAGERLAGRVAERGPVALDTPCERIEERFGDALEAELLAAVQEDWSRMTRARGRMDRYVDELREATSRLLAERLDDVRRHGDRLIEEHAARGGVAAALAAFRRLRDHARDALEARETRRRHAEELARRHGVPSTGTIGVARRRVIEAAGERPDDAPIRFGLGLWLLLSPALAAPMTAGVAALVGWPLPDGLAAIVGGWAWLIGTAGVFAAGAGAVLWFQRRRHRRLVAAVDDLAHTVRRLFSGSGRPVEEEALVSVRSFFDSRLQLGEAIAGRAFALRLFERIECDRSLADRLERSIDVQATCLVRQAEDLGVRPSFSAGGATVTRQTVGDDVSRLFDSRGRGRSEPLLDPEDLVDYYRRWSGEGEEIDRLLPALLARAGGFDRWRHSACLSDTDALLAFGREQFAFLIERTLVEQHRFTRQIGARLCDFVARYFPNLGFAARFAGFEGLDPDGVEVAAEASLVVHPDLASLFRQSRERAEAPRMTRTLEVRTVDVRPGAAYMLSLAQGIRAHSVRNLKRFESFHDRTRMPDDMSFPVSGEMAADSVNHLSGYGDLSQGLHGLFRNARASGARPR